MIISLACLGGAGEIGMNMYVYECGNYAIIVDCGVKFANSNEPSIDFIIPDFTYLKSISHKKLLLALSHAHEDHVGAIGFLLDSIPNVTIAANSYTFDMIEGKLKGRKVEHILLDNKQTLEWGDFKLTPYYVSHSIHNTFAFHLAIDKFSLLHISDYKIDVAPITSNGFSLKDFIELGHVDCLVADSTNMKKNKFVLGERVTVAALDKVFSSCDGRIFFTTFASNIERINTILNLCKKHNRRILIEGPSITRNLEIAKKHGKVSFDESLLINRKELANLKDKRVCIIATGSQGENTSVITRIAGSDYSNIRVQEGDTFIFSARQIPGNESSIIRVMNNIYKLGGRCITCDDEAEIHVSGHASKLDGTLLIKLLKPNFLIPIHGEVVHLRAHIDLGVKCGIDKENAILMLSGDKLSFKKDKGSKEFFFSTKHEIASGEYFVDSDNYELLSPLELRERKRLSMGGIALLHIFYKDLSQFHKASLDLSILGFKVSEEKVTPLKESLKTLLSSLEGKKVEIVLNEEESDTISLEKIRLEFISLIKTFFKKRFSKKPFIEVIFKEYPSLI